MIRDRILLATIVVALGLATPSLFADEPGIIAREGCEDLQYSWQVRGGLSWIAGLAFPTSGIAELRTWEDMASGHFASLLQISVPGREDYYRYESEFENGATLRTIMTFHGYIWGRKERHDRTFFDYANKLSRRRKEAPPKPPEVRIRAIPDHPLQDILTGIYFLRLHAPGVREALPVTIYSDGSLYDVVYGFAGAEQARVGGRPIRASCFEVGTADDAEERWQGGLRICISDDDRRTPVRILIRRGRLASLDLELTSVRDCDPVNGGVPGGR